VERLLAVPFRGFSGNEIRSDHLDLFVSGPHRPLFYLYSTVQTGLLQLLSQIVDHPLFSALQRPQSHRASWYTDECATD